MIIRITENMFRATFAASGRDTGWTHAGLGKLYDYVEEHFDCMYELDPVALDCEFTEHEGACPEKDQDDIAVSWEDGYILRT